MAPPIRLGILTPSSNTALEPLTTRMLAGLPDVTAHFSRFPVTRIALDGAAVGQFGHRPVLDAATLLADAKVHAIVWSGTAAGWLGFETDEELCRNIQTRTGIPAGTSVLALNEALSVTGCRTVGLITPYTADVQNRIIRNYAAAGIACAAETHLGIADNFSFATVTEETLADLCRTVAAAITARPAALVTFCTNLRAAHLAETLEQTTGLPHYDTTATAVWQGLRLTGADPGRLRGWGSLFGIS